ncbi:MAG: MotA/TolQ/ExbB proton channel family protein [Gammaproteobacteria bacterium]|nr:MotA/TolQ/ExbB proton channel family protein [Gammaproteobacteria bacterium]
MNAADQYSSSYSWYPQYCGSLIIERYWFLLFIYPQKLDSIVKQWEQRSDHNTWHALRLREGLSAEVSLTLQAYLSPIKIIIQVLPLLGLLGTVTGMITIFDVITVFGTGNTRGMADGISRALITTTAGLTTAIAGLYFSVHLEHRAHTEQQRARDQLHISG